MERSLWKLLAPLPIMASAILVNSCIYDKPPGDEFYRTLWKSEEVDLGQFEVSSLTLEFLCNDGVSISLGDELTVYGTYSPEGMTTALNDVSAYICSGGEESSVRFIEATRDGDTLQLIWQSSDSSDPSTTTMHRLSAYE